MHEPTFFFLILVFIEDARVHRADVRGERKRVRLQKWICLGSRKVSNNDIAKWKDSDWRHWHCTSQFSLRIHESILFLVASLLLRCISLNFFLSPMEDRFYEEDEWYFQFQDFKYTLSPELFPAMNISKDFLLYLIECYSFQILSCAVLFSHAQVCSQLSVSVPPVLVQRAACLKVQRRFVTRIRASKKASFAHFLEFMFFLLWTQMWSATCLMLTFPVSGLR